MINGMDCAQRLTAQNAADLKAAGYEFCGRYLVPARGSLKWKALTRAEAEIITAVGMKILAVWEITADRVKGGAEQGLKDGAEAAQLARDMGIPTSAIIYFAVDYDAQSAEYSVIEAYLRAARSQTGEYEIGVYGSYGVVEAMAARHACKGFWQCVAWSYGKKSKHLTVYQSHWQEKVCKIAIDTNECPDADAAGLWNYEEDNMTGEEIYTKLKEYTKTLPPPDWAKGELEEAQEMGITDGTRPMELVPRYQAAIMAMRAVKAAKK